MIEKGDKSTIIKEINSLLKYDDKNQEISPQILKLLELEELIDMRDKLLIGKKFLRDETISWFDELYEKTKKD
jgi:hypothetical protein